MGYRLLEGAAWATVDLADLRDVIRAHRHRPLIVVATIGTTMTEAVDPVSDIRAALSDYAVTRARATGI